VGTTTQVGGEESSSIATTSPLPEMGLHNFLFVVRALQPHPTFANAPISPNSI
jgi:hypothetical protein